MWPFSKFKDYERREKLLGNILLKKDQEITHWQTLSTNLQEFKDQDLILIKALDSRIDNQSKQIHALKFQLINHKKINLAYIAKIVKE